MAKWEEIKTTKDRIEPEIFKIDGVNYCDIETEILDNGELGEAILLVGTKDEALIPLIEKEVKSLAGEYEVKVIQFEYILTSSKESDAVSAANKTKYRPLIGGCNIGVGIERSGRNQDQGTLGIFLPSKTSPNSYVGVSNEHVIGTFRSVNQPVIDGSVQPPFPVPIMSSSDHGVLGGPLDANYCTFTNYTGFITREVLGIGAIRGSVSPAIGMTVKKSGMMSGVTSGTITSINATIEFDDRGTKILFNNQIKVSNSGSGSFQIKGDSGSGLFTSFEGDSVNKSAKMVGLMSAKDDKGNGYANHIGEVLGEFNLSIDSHVPFYQLYGNEDHFYTTNYYDMNGSGGKAGYDYQNIECFLWPTADAASDLVPLYRWYAASVNDHLYTTDANEKPGAYVYQGVAGYVKKLGSKKPSEGRALVNLIRWYNSAIYDHVLTTTMFPGLPPGYRAEAPIGMVMSPTTYVGE